MMQPIARAVNDNSSIAVSILIGGRLRLPPSGSVLMLRCLLAGNDSSCHTTGSQDKPRLRPAPICHLASTLRLAG